MELPFIVNTRLMPFKMRQDFDMTDYDPSARVSMHVWDVITEVAVSVDDADLVVASRRAISFGDRVFIRVGRGWDITLGSRLYRRPAYFAK